MSDTAAAAAPVDVPAVENPDVLPERQLPDIPDMTGWPPELKKKVMISFMFMHVSAEEEFQEKLQIHLQVMGRERDTHTQNGHTHTHTKLDRHVRLVTIFVDNNDTSGSIRQHSTIC